MIDFGNVLDANTCVRVLWARLMQNPPDFCLEPVAGVSTLLVVIKPQYRDWKYLSQYCKVMEQWGQQALGQAPASGREITLPICYETLMAPDLDRVAEFCGLSQKEIIQHHQSGVYLAELIGFMPGFAYLSGVDPTLNVPRLPTPIWILFVSIDVALNSAVIMMLCSVGILGGLGHLLFVLAFYRASPSTLTPFVYLQMIWAIMFGWLIFSQFPDSIALVGMAVIVASGLWLILHRRRSNSESSSK